MATNQIEIRTRSRTFRGTAAVSKFRVVTQGADSSDFFRTCIQAAAITDVPAGISRNAIESGAEGSIGQEGEFPVEVAAAVAVNDLLIVDSVGGIGRVKPVGAAVAPYWIIGIARTVQATVGSVTQVEYRPRFVGTVAEADIYALGGHRSVVGPFVQDNVAASQAAVALALGSTGKPQLGFVAPRAGSLVGVSVLSSVAAAGSVASLIVTKNTVATALLTTLDSTVNGGLKNFAVAAKDAVTFAAGDIIGVTVTTDGSWTATTADIDVFVEFED